VWWSRAEGSDRGSRGRRPFHAFVSIPSSFDRDLVTRMTV
jgi:hypothetical protein